MKGLLLAFLWMAGNGWAACASGTISYLPFNGDAVDPCGGYTWTNNGSVPFVSSPTACQGSQMAGGFSDASYFSSSASFRTALQSATNYSVEAYVYVTSAATAPMIVSTNAFGLLFGVTTDRRIRFYTAAGTSDVYSATSIIPLNTCTNVAVTYDGTDKKIYVNGSLTRTATANGSLGTITACDIGRINGLGGAGFTGYIDGLRFSSVARTSFPTVDPSGVNNDKRGLSLRGVLRVGLK